jgi:hypothetical protein
MADRATTDLIRAEMYRIMEPRQRGIRPAGGQSVADKKRAKDKKTDEAELEALIKRAMSEPGVAEAIEVYEKTEGILSAAALPYDFTSVADTTSTPRR